MILLNPILYQRFFYNEENLIKINIGIPNNFFDKKTTYDFGRAIQTHDEKSFFYQLGISQEGIFGRYINKSEISNSVILKLLNSEKIGDILKDFSPIPGEFVNGIQKYSFISKIDMENGKKYPTFAINHDSLNK